MAGVVKDEIKGNPWFNLLPKEVAKHQVLWERRRAIYRALRAERAVSPRGALMRVAEALGLSPYRVDLMANKDMKRRKISEDQHVWVEGPSPVERFLKTGLAEPRLVSRRTTIEIYSDSSGTTERTLSSVTVHESP